MVRFSYDIQNCIRKYGTNGLRIHRSVYESSTNQVRIKGNSWQFLTIREIFSLKLGIKCQLTLLGYYIKNKCSLESCCCIGSTFGVPIPTVDSTKKTSSKNLRKGDPDFLTHWLENLLVIVCHHHHQPVTVLINLPLFSTPGACAFASGGVVNQRGCLRSPLLLFPCLFSLFRISE